MKYLVKNLSKYFQDCERFLIASSYARKSWWRPDNGQCEAHLPAIVTQTKTRLRTRGNLETIFGTSFLQRSSELGND